ncbi:MAG: ATP-binding protein [Halobacteriota archaeon]
MIEDETIVALVRHRQNRRLLVDRLGSTFDVTTELPDSVDDVDCLVVDEGGLEHDRATIQSVTEAAAPVFVPVLLVTSDADRIPERVWKLVDEVVEVPVDATVLENRIETLLHTRRQSLDIKRQQERSEHRFRQLFQAAPDPVLVVEDDGTIVDANEAFLAWVERDRPDVVGENVLEIGFEPGDVLERILLRVESTDGPGEKTVTHVDSSGRAQISELDAEILSYLGESTERIGIFRDVTERVTSRKGLEEQIERLDEFSGIVSHDLRNPLNIAMGNLEIVREECDTPELETIETSLERMDTLIGELLDFARAGNMVTEPDVVSLADMRAAASAMFDDADDVTVVGETDATIYGDEEQVRRIFDNAFRNAREHAGPDVTIWVGETEDGFFIEDDGPGVPRSDRQSVLESGFTTTDGSSGLGLSIVSTIATAHDWTVRIESGRRGGAKLVFDGVTFVDPDE